MKLKQIHYGWIMVLISMVALATYAMVIYTFGIFLVPVTLEFGWDRGALSAVLSVTMLVGGGLAILTGRLSDKYGPRPLITANCILAGIAFLLMTQINALWQVYLIWGLLMGIAFSCCMVPILSTIPRWFAEKRGIAVGLTMVGYGSGGVIGPPLAQWLISSYGWQQAYLVMGLITLIIVIPPAQFMKHSPQRVGLKPYGEKEVIETQNSPPVVGGLSLKQAAKTGRFWIFGLITFSFLFCIQLIVVHIAPHAIDIGILAMVAASIVSIIAIASLIGRLGVGFLSDRVGPRKALLACLAIFILALIWLLFTKEIWMFYVFAVMFGIAYGGETSVMTLVPAELFGLKHLGTIAAAAFLWGAIGGAIGPFIAGTIFDITESYRLAFLICVMIGALAVTLGLILSRSKSYEDISLIKSGSGGI